MVRLLPRSTLFPYTTLFRSWRRSRAGPPCKRTARADGPRAARGPAAAAAAARAVRSEEHTSELQSHSDLVCRLLLEKKKKHRAIVKNYLHPQGSTTTHAYSP